MKSDDIVKQLFLGCGAIFSYTQYSKSEVLAWTMWDVTKMKGKHTLYIYSYSGFLITF